MYVIYKLLNNRKKKLLKFIIILYLLLLHFPYIKNISNKRFILFFYGWKVKYCSLLKE